MTGSSPAVLAAGLSFRNPRVQRLRRLARDPAARRAEGAFVVEGPKLLGAALDAGAPLEAVYVEGGGEGPEVARAAAAGIEVVPLAAGVLGRVADAASPPPVLAVATPTPAPLEGLREAALVVVCVDLRDPGNLGAVLRSAEAAGADGVVCCDGTADIYGPKCVRASAGAVFRLPAVAGGEPAAVLGGLGSWGMQRLGATARGGTAHHGVDFSRPTALVLGNEAHGLPPEVEAEVDGLVTVPMAGAAESLNVAAAATVLCFEAQRQRRP